MFFKDAIARRIISKLESESDSELSDYTSFPSSSEDVAHTEYEKQAGTENQPSFNKGKKRIRQSVNNEEISLKTKRVQSYPTESFGKPYITYSEPARTATIPPSETDNNGLGPLDIKKPDSFWIQLSNETNHGETKQ